MNVRDDFVSNYQRDRCETASALDAIRAFVTTGAGLARLHPDDLMGRITLVRAGLPAEAVDVIAADLDISKEAVYELLGITRATASRQVRERKNLSAAATERAVFIAGLVKMVEEMIPEDSRRDDFDASKWVAHWLDHPQPVLAGKAPRSFLDTADGRSLVHRMLVKMESGAYA